MSRLTDLAVGDRARVVGYLESSRFTEQLKHLGLTPGTEFEVKRFAPLGDPMEIRIRGFSLCLRPSEAGALQVERL